MAKKVEILTRNHARRGSAAVVALVSLSLLVCMGTPRKIFVKELLRNLSQKQDSAGQL